MIEPDQIRAARAFLGWGQQQLADAAGLSIGVVKKAEDAGRDVRASSLRSIERALEAAGIVFLTDRDAPQITKGVGIRRPQA